MKLLQLLNLLYFWIYSGETVCHSQCKCEGSAILDCSGKSWEHLPDGFDIPKSVEMIIINNNNFVNFSQFGVLTGQWPNVTTLDISENKIIHVEDNRFNDTFPNLSNLYVSNNQIREIKHKAFYGLKLLTTLYLDRNQISLITSDAFDNLANLAELNLANNLLSELDFRWFRNLTSLSQLHLADNRITRVESLMHTWPPSLKSICLQHNRISVLLPIPKHVEMFNLEGNPIYCGCIPENLNDISNFTLCSVKMQCNSIELKVDCKNKPLSEEIYTFWQDIAAKPVCQAPVITELGLVRNQDKLPILTCAATGVPAPNISVFSSETGQNLHANGVEKSNFTSVTMNQLISGTYSCQASNKFGAVSRKRVVDFNDDCNSTCRNWNQQSEVPDLHKQKSSKFIIYISV